MKKILKLLLPITFLIGALYSIKAQSYQPMVVNNANWIYYYSSPSNEQFLYGYTIFGDTMVDGTIYKKLYYRTYDQSENDSGVPNWYPDGPFEYVDEYLMGYIRENPEDRNVYCMITESVETNRSNCIVNEEFLFYDFSLSLNDTLKTCNVELQELFPFTIDDIYMKELYGMERRFFENRSLKAKRENYPTKTNSLHNVALSSLF